MGRRHLVRTVQLPVTLTKFEHAQRQKFITPNSNLAKNAGTRVEEIERFYARNLAPLLRDGEGPTGFGD